MKFSFWYRLMNKNHSRRHKDRRRERRVDYASKLFVESLEDRVLLNNDTPFILSVKPGDGAVLQGVNSQTPLITVTFSEPVNATQATNRANYLLFSSSGQTINIDSVTANGINQNNNSTTSVTLAYNEGKPLPPATYSLFVRGDQIQDVDDNRFLAQPGQFVVANTGTNNVSVINVSDSGVVGGLGNYPDPTNTTATPQLVAFGNFDGVTDSHGNPIPDLVVVNAGTNTISVFQGRVGGGFNLNPTVTLGLPGGANPSGVVITDLNKDGLPDIAVSDAGTDEVSVLLNNRPVGSIGQISFASEKTYAAGPAPSGIVAADFNQDGNIDLAVSDKNQDMTNGLAYEVSVLLGNGDGTFGAPNKIKVGDTVSGVTSPTSIAAGLLNNDVFPDIVVGGGGGNSQNNFGLGVLFNTTKPGGSLSFAGLQTLTPTQTTSVAVGPIDGTNHIGIAATTAGASAQLLLWQNDGSGNFTQANPINLNKPATGITLQDVNGDNKNDILIANNQASAPGSVSVLINQSNGSTLSYKNPVSYSIPGIPVDVALGDTNQDGTLDLVTANSTSNDISLLVGNPNGTFRTSTDFSMGANASPSNVVTADLNGDGLPDLITVNQGTGQIAIQLATAPGVYGAPTFMNVGKNPIAAAVGDLLVNGRQDIVVANQGDNTVTVLLNDGTGQNFTVSTVNVGLTPTGVALGDFNSDGFLDIAVSHNGSTTDATKRGVTILLNNQNGSFRRLPDIAVGTFASALAVGDFNGDGHADIAVANNQATGTVLIFSGDGKGGFTQTGTVNTIDNPTSLTVGDLNADGFPDIVVGGGASTGTSTGNLGILINENGVFLSSVNLTVRDAFTVLGNVAITDINQDGHLDLLVSIASESFIDKNGVVNSITPINNVFSLLGDGQGNFATTQPFLGGGLAAAPSMVSVISNPLIHAETFTIVGAQVTTNLVRNGIFQQSQLNNPQGYLAGWNLWHESGSRGTWSGQNIALPSGFGPVTPLSATPVAPPPGQTTAAILDQADINYFDNGGIDQFGDFATFFDEFPLGSTGIGGTLGFGTGTPADYQGTNILYQDFTIPTTTTSLTLSLNLMLFSANAFTNPNQVSALTYTTQQHNQQFRIDLMDPNANPEDVGSGVLKNLFQTTPATSAAGGYTPISMDLTPFLSTLAGKTVRLRFAGVTNIGKLVVGVSNVHLDASFNAQMLPEIQNLRLRNPGFGTTPATAGSTSDQAILGQVLSQDIGSPNDIRIVQFDTSGTGKFQPGTTFAINSLQWDANGNFAFDFRKVIPGGLLPGPHTINVRAIDVAGDTFTTSINFTVQGPSNNGWQAQGPGAILTAGTGVEYSSVSGDVTAIAPDPRDPSGNTIYLGAANGGVWKSTDGGKNWTPLTDYVVDGAGNPVPENIGGLGVGASASDPAGSPSDVIYAATGVATLSAYGHPGKGILKSIDGGRSWTVVGETEFNGALVSKLVVDPTNANRVYVAVAAGGEFGPGVYGTSDGGMTWSNLTVTTNMFVTDGKSLSQHLINSLTSVTDIAINPFNTEDLLIGIGNMGLANGDPKSAGVWQSGNFGGSWSLVVGGTNSNVPNNSLLSGFNGDSLGRINLALGTGTAADAGVWYVMMVAPPASQVASPPGGPAPFLGLFKSKDFGLDWTKVQLREELPKPNGNTIVERWDDINPVGDEANNVGALVVDPTNPNIVYLGGSNRYNPQYFDPVDKTIFFFNGKNELVHPFLMVDTSQIADVTAEFPGPASGRGAPHNSGDSWVEESEAWANFTGFPVNDDGSTYPGTTTQSATGSNLGVGAYWVDLQKNISGNDGWEGVAPELSLLPSGINFLTFNGAGRLLVGTAGGIFEGFSGGFNPGFNPDDVVVFGVPPNPQEFDFPIHLFDVGIPSFVNLNGNLQISNLTSVAVNPTNPNIFYTSQGDTGTSTSTGSLTWLPMIFTSLGVAPFGEAFIPSAAAVRISPPDPTIPHSQPKVYVTWQFADRNTGLQVDVSTNGGVPGSFSVMDAGIRTLTDNANQFPVLTANGSDPAGELIFGTQAVYETDTGAATWDTIGSSTLDPKGVITAAAIAPSGQDFFYVGTSTGNVYVTQNNGADGFPLKVSGLPTGVAVNGITVDPNNPNLAYVMFGGIGLSHVWKTSDGGNTWTNISAGLPDVPAFSMAIDPTAVPGAAQGRLYLGTQVGVFVSNDRGQTWAQLGQGLPHAPVVDLQFDSKSKELAAAVQGRGVFTVYTDVQGPAVTSVSPTTPGAPPLNSITVNFNKPVLPTSFVIGNQTAARNTQVVNVLDHSLEYFQDEVAGWYQRFLMRAATPAEIANYANPLQQGTMTDEQVISQIVGLDEYFQKRANSNNTTWFVVAYTDLVGVGPSQTQINQALNDLKTESRATVAFNDILTTTPYQQTLVNSLFNQYLQRAPSASEMNNALGLIANGATDEQLITQIVSSPEFYQVDGSRFALNAGLVPGPVALGNLSGALDSNRKPIPDLIVGSGNSPSNLNTLLIYQGLAGGGFSSTPVSLLFPNSPNPVNPSAIVVADFNHDGLQDIAVADQANNQVVVFLNNRSTTGTISFAPGVAYNAGNAPIAMVAANLDPQNQDNNPELILADGQPDNGGNFNIVILQGNGDGTFNATPTVINTGLGQLTGIAAGDLNGDGLNDLAVSSVSGVTAFFNQTTTVGQYVFPANLQQQLTTDVTTSVAIGRVDTTANNSVVATTPFNGGQVLIFQNQGGSSPTFSAPIRINAGPRPVGVTLKDLLGVGLNDIVVANNASQGTVTILRNRTARASIGLDTISFGAPVSYDVGSSPTSIALGDVNRDGTQDFVTADVVNDDAWVSYAFNDGSLHTPTDQDFINQAFQRLLNRLPSSTEMNTYFTNLGNAEQTYLIGPRGRTVPLSISINDPNKGSNYPFDTSYQLTFAPQTEDGTYTLKVGPNTLGNNILDFIGLAQDQNRNQVNGENPGDQFTTQFALATTDDSSFISSVYQSLLNRAPSNADFISNYSTIEAQRSALLNSLASKTVTSTRAQILLIDGIFNLLVNRFATTAELLTNVNSLRNGGQVQQIYANVSASNEFYANSGGTTDGFINAVYQALLSRAPTAAELSSGESQLGSNPTQPTRLTYTQQLVAGIEFRTDLVQAAFIKFLGRYATNDEVSQWTATLAQPSAGPGTPSRYEQMEISLSSSSEFFLRQQDIDNGLATNNAWLTSVYSLVRQEAPGQLFLNDYNSLLNGYAPQRTALVNTLDHSVEYYTDLVNGYFSQFLLGTPTAQQLSTYVGQLQGGTPTENVIAQIIASDQFFTQVANSSNAQWASLLYQLLLNTSPPPGLVGQLNSGQITRLQAALNVTFGNDYLTQRINGYFMTYVGRPATQQDLNTWLPAIQNQTKLDQDLITTLIASTEYYNRLTNFQPPQVGGVPATLPFTDTFSTGTELSNFWTNQVGNITVVHGNAYGESSLNLATVNGINQGDEVVKADLTLASGQWGALITRYSGAGDNNYYLGQLLSTATGFQATIWKNVNGAFTLLNTGSTSVTGTGTLEFEAVGASLKLIFNGKLVAFAQDTTFATGSMGVRISTVGTFTNFQAAAVTQLNATLPFTDNFTTTSDGSQLSRFWLDQTGNITVVNGLATGEGSFNLSTVNGINSKDMAVTGSINLSGSQWVALVSRYSGPAENNFYLGQLLGNGNGTFTPTIWKKVNGVWTKLNTGANINSANGTLEFETVGPSLKLLLNGQILTWADDTDLASGSVGMRLSQNTTLGNFQAVAVATQTGSLPFSDNFSTTSDGSQLDRQWTDQTGNITVVGGLATGKDAFNLSTVNGLSGTDMAVTGSINLSGSQWVALVSRYSGPLENNFYLGQLLGNGNGTFTPTIWKKVGGVWTKLNTGANINSANGTLEFETVGPSLKLILNGQILTWADDTSLASGSVGMRLSQNTTLGNFQAVAVATQTGSLPFSDNFSTTSDGSQLDRQWTDQTGNITVVGGLATGKDAFNLSTVNGLSGTDMAVTGSINLSGSQWVALVSRYSGPLENNFYLGQLLGNGNGTFTPTIWKKVGGVWTKLNTGANINSANGTLEFETVGPSLKLLLNGQILTWADDTDLASGSVGMRLSQNTTLGNFQAVAVATQTGSLPFSDNFSTTSDGSQLDRQWTDQTGNITVVGGLATGKDAFNLSTVNGLSGTDMAVTGSINLSGSQWVALVSRYSGPLENNFYLGQLLGNGNGTFTPTIWKKVGGVWTKLNTGANINSANGTLEFETVGPSLKLILNGQILTWADDTSLASGSVGMRLSQTTTLGNFQAVAVTTQNASLPFSDNFTTTSDGSQLSRKWTDRTGNITVSGGKAVGKDSFNLSTLNGLNVANVTVTGNIALGSTQWAALVARYSGPLEDNFYLGQLLGNGDGTFTATIWKKVSGVWTKLATSAAISTGTGTLNFQVIGSTLQVSMNGNVLATAIDTDLGSGSVGMRLGLNTTLANFTAS